MCKIILQGFFSHIFVLNEKNTVITYLSILLSTRRQKRKINVIKKGDNA